MLDFGHGALLGFHEMVSLADGARTHLITSIQIGTHPHGDLHAFLDPGLRDGCQVHRERLGAETRLRGRGLLNTA
jgi:hypothetical protein